MCRTPVLLVLTLLLAGCGGGGGPTGPTEAERVRAAVVAYRDAVAHHDYAALCTRIFTPALTAKFDRSGYPCQVAMRQYLGLTKNPTVKILGVRIRGRRATVGIQSGAVGQAPVEGSLGLVKIVGSWRLERLSAAGQRT